MDGKAQGRAKQLKDDLSVFASVLQVLGVVVALIAWMLTWPGTVVPTALSLMGITAYIGIRAGTGAAIGAMLLGKWGGVISAVGIAASWIIAMAIGVPLLIGNVYLARGLGVVTLAAIGYYSVPPAVAAIRSRYGWRQGPTHGRDDSDSSPSA